MNLEEYQNEDGMKVWLSEREVDQLLDQFDDTEKRIAVGLAVRCGLRADEVLDVAPEHSWTPTPGRCCASGKARRPGRTARL